MASNDATLSATTSSSKVPEESPKALLPVEAMLENELASLVRVRNRLALANDSNLPKILTGLLPRVLVKLEATYQLRNAKENEKCQLLRSQIRGHLMGILMHALERIRGNVDMAVPWMSPIAVSLESDCRVVRMIVLSLLQAAIARCTPKTTPLTALLKAVDRCYRRQEDLNEASRLELQTTSWLVLDAIAIVSGLKPMIDWDMDCYNEEGRLGVYEPPQNFSEAAPLVNEDAIDAVNDDGAGVFHLMLDMMLFWPSPPSRRQWPQMNNREEATSGGISLQGRGIMTFRLKERSWNDMTRGYLRYLKAACFNVCVSKKHPCIFQGDDNGEARALMLSVMLANGNSMVGTQANDYLNVHFANSQPMFDAPKEALSGCSLTMACSLLVLVLGDEASNAILDKHSSQHQCLNILGPQPSDISAMRTPLPPPISAKVIEFISNRLVVSESCVESNTDELKLYVDLAVTVQRKHLNDGIWSIRLIYGLYKQIEVVRDKAWLDDFHSNCIACAKDTLAGLPEPAPVARATVMDEGEGQVLPQEGDQINRVERIIARRRAENELFVKHRNLLRKKRLRYDDAFAARENAYEIISNLGCSRERNIQDGEEELTFDLPIILFKCAIQEDTMMKPRAMSALSSLLDAFESMVDNAGGDPKGSSLQRQVAYLIPSLVDASYCESEAVRLASAQWTARVLLLIDAPAAYCLSCFLSNDTDAKVAATAKSIVNNPELQKYQDHVKQQSVYEFLDLSNANDCATLTMELEVRIATVAKELDIPTSAASVILSSFDGSSKAAIDACKDDRDGVLRRCGVKARCETVSPNIGLRRDIGADDDDMNDYFLCGICYDDEVTSTDSYVMACGHRFCIRCWKAFLGNKVEEGPSQILNASCPNQKCDERVTGVELNELVPHKVPKWKQFILRQFVDQESHYRFCPGPDCEVVVVSPLGDIGPVECNSCKTSFCFGCRQEPHIPAQCSDFEKWQKIFGSSEFWVAKHSKPCPQCGVPIEKNQGCNHIQCSQCQFDFCWICLAHLESHNMAHSCNRYDPADHAEDDDEKMKLFYTDRFQAHEEAELFARKRLKSVEDKVQHLLDKFWLLGVEEAQDIVKAEETLLEARRFLKFSYIAAYGMKDNRGRRKIFESHQGALELLTETLSGLSELDLDSLYVDRGESNLRLHLRAICFYSSVVERYMERITNLDYQDGIP